MITLWEGVLTAVLVLVLTGLATLAYKHPAGYARIHGIFWITSSVIAGWYSTFILGVQTGIISAFCCVSSLEKIQELGQQWPASRFFVAPAVSYFLLSAYMAFLRYLPKLIDRDSEYVPWGVLVIGIRNASSDLDDKHRNSPVPRGNSRNNAIASLSKDRGPAKGPGVASRSRRRKS